MPNRQVAPYERYDPQTGRTVQVRQHARQVRARNADVPAKPVDVRAVLNDDPFAQCQERLPVRVRFDDLFGFSGRDLLRQSGPFVVEGWRASSVSGNLNRLRDEHVTEDAGDSIFGPGVYLAADKEGAEQYGHDISRSAVTLHRPKVVDLDEADVPMEDGQPDFGMLAEELSWHASQARAHGHDSIVVKYPETVADEWGGETTYRREIFLFAEHAEQAVNTDSD